MFDHFYDTMGYHNNIMASQKQTWSQFFLGLKLKTKFL